MSALKSQRQVPRAVAQWVGFTRMVYVLGKSCRSLDNLDVRSDGGEDGWRRTTA